MNDENEKIIDAITSMPDRNTALSIAKSMNDQGVTDFKITNEKILKPLVELNRRHKFTNILKFLEYVDKYKTNDTVLYLDSLNGLCHCIVDEKKTQGMAENISCKAINEKLFDTFQKMEQIANSTDLLAFVKNNRLLVRDFISFYSTMNALKVSSSVEKVDINGESSEYSVIVKSEVKGVSKGGPVELPKMLVVAFEDYQCDLQNPTIYIIEADIYYNVRKDTGVSIEVKVRNKEQLKIEMSANYSELIEANKPSEVLLVWGYPDYSDVRRYTDED